MFVIVEHTMLAYKGLQDFLGSNMARSEYSTYIVKKQRRKLWIFHSQTITEQNRTNQKQRIH